MFPIGHDNPSSRRPYVTWALILANFAIFFYQESLPHAARDAFTAHLALIPAHLLADPQGQVTTLISHAFLHANLPHILGNMLFLWVFADNIEDEMGHLGFLGFYLLGSVLAGLASVASRPHDLAPGIGASGAIAAVIGAYLVLHAFAPIRLLIAGLLPISLFMQGELPIINLPAWSIAIVWFAMQVAGGAQALFSPAGVDYAAHVGGFLAGFLIVRGLRLFGFWPDQDFTPPLERRSPAPDVRLREYVAASSRLEAGTVLEPTHLRWVVRRHERLEPDTVPAARFRELFGRRLKVAHYPLEPILWSDLEPSEQPALADPSAGASGQPQLTG